MCQMVPKNNSPFSCTSCRQQNWHIPSLLYSSHLEFQNFNYDTLKNNNYLLLSCFFQIKWNIRHCIMFGFYSYSFWVCLEPELNIKNSRPGIHGFFIIHYYNISHCNNLQWLVFSSSSYLCLFDCSHKSRLSARKTKQNTECLLKEQFFWMGSSRTGEMIFSRTP